LSGPPRSVLLLAVLGVAGLLAWRSYATLEEPIREVARDYLALRRVQRHHDVLRAAGEESGVDPHLLAALMVCESSGRVDAVSKAGALGLFQLSTVTAEWRAENLGLEKPTREQLLSDALLNARLGADNLAWLLRTFDGDELRALCAYNAGARKLKRLTDAEGGWEAWRAKGEESGRSEILAYAERVLRMRDDFLRRGLFEKERERGETSTPEIADPSPTNGRDTSEPME